MRPARPKKLQNKICLTNFRENFRDRRLGGTHAERMGHNLGESIDAAVAIPAAATGRLESIGDKRDGTSLSLDSKQLVIP